MSEQPAQTEEPEGGPGAQHVLIPEEILAAIQANHLVAVNAQDLATPGLDAESKQALIRQLDAWASLAKFATWLSVGLAISSVLLCVFLLSAMTWGGLFAGSQLWEFTFILFALAVFVASPLTIFVIGRPLKGIDEWAPTLSTTRQQNIDKN
jgi:hypothetical protein